MVFCVKREYDFAIRICAYLGGNYLKGPIPLSIISENLFITRPFATKIVYQLKGAHILDTVQGKVGGVFLNVAPQNLTLFQILQGMGMHDPVSQCVNDPEFCPLPPPCRIHSFFIEEENRLIRELKSRTLEEFIFTEADFDAAKVEAFKKSRLEDKS
ncbi:MAG: Rrf2 family transcriptional regulator [Deferribacteres bacterium]|nr:Rrf2 family transcriptional regulator [candidate division KSB1 bacterium]MCB9504143.1 Rrf2 family transcriptional regulator [Deferribacteres bacterium]